ncbi:non-canonical purine NTP pyrophosphatase [Helicobacter didelphidarum]|uniref:Non-canonical purine NTP pyrophosphatase n=1 Tax=Helicobacter didelphidarum TaxID=2040648 RepID=A0A3D8IJ57_9HELI|nr:non-canonical purine NTP pyrophosphatase [Helicobacter didelphidarum]RDU64926.1 non-canonical purine NTP pyrophosphatase [Helicobacter didelphidarum]
MQYAPESKDTYRIILATNNTHKLKEFSNAFGKEIYTPQSLGIQDFNPTENGKTFEENALIKANALHVALKQQSQNNMIILADDSGLCVEALNGGPGVFSARFAHIINNNVTAGNSSDTENRQALKRELKKRGIWGSKAFFQCSIAYIIDYKQTEESIYQKSFLVKSGIASGICNGIVAIKELGSHGFGYDSMFYRDFEGTRKAELMKCNFLLEQESSDIYQHSSQDSKIKASKQQDFYDTHDITKKYSYSINHILESLQYSLASIPLEEKMKISHRGKAIAELKKILQL